MSDDGGATAADAAEPGGDNATTGTGPKESDSATGRGTTDGADGPDQDTGLDSSIGDAFDKLAREAYERGRQVLDPTTVIAGRDAQVTMRTQLVLTGRAGVSRSPGRMREEQLEAVRACYVEVPGYPALLELLRNRHLLVLAGATGQRTLDDGDPPARRRRRGHRLPPRPRRPGGRPRPADPRAGSRLPRGGGHRRAHVRRRRRPVRRRPRTPQRVLRPRRRGRRRCGHGARRVHGDLPGARPARARRPARRRRSRSGLAARARTSVAHPRGGRPRCAGRSGLAPAPARPRAWPACCCPTGAARSASRTSRRSSPRSWTTRSRGGSRCWTPRRTASGASARGG